MINLIKSLKIQLPILFKLDAIFLVTFIFTGLFFLGLPIFLGVDIDSTGINMLRGELIYLLCLFSIIIYQIIYSAYSSFFVGFSITRKNIFTSMQIAKIIYSVLNTIFFLIADFILSNLFSTSNIDIIIGIVLVICTQIFICTIGEFWGTIFVRFGILFWVIAFIITLGIIIASVFYIISHFSFDNNIEQILYDNYLSISCVSILTSVILSILNYNIFKNYSV